MRVGHVAKLMGWGCRSWVLQHVTLWFAAGLFPPPPPHDDMKLERRRCIQEERLQHANLHLFGLHRHFHSMLLAFRWLDKCPIHISSTVIVGSRT
ncbi:hypothetical protein Y1Q_0003305 [Alligator mississippiensis]|uniref:Secreted protein n=1 Tax=Alligator mississippiensis TaxID=8496 RepID=A0A151ME95_ALLMI|nr:hypothetical protein Y1Q_0003305 [Alligator mississippiensis]